MSSASSRATNVIGAHALANRALADQALAASRAWVEQFVVSHNLCPFAGREVTRQTIRYVAVSAHDWHETLDALIGECRRLDEDAALETTLLVLSDGVNDFDDYLDLLGVAEALFEEQGYEGVYQLASFHPDYCFDGVEEDDPANYTNRSPWPMLHLLREDAIAKALTHYPDPEAIPERNAAAMTALGGEALAATLAALTRAGEQGQ
ncbi:DUF1415 domain-containing protein [Onishia taeanensis]